MKQLLLFFTSLLLTITLIGCGNDDSTTEGQPASEPDDSQFLKVSIDRLQLDYQQGSRKLQVESNAKWSINSKHDWLSFSSSSGEADGGVTIVWPANLTYADRSDTITVSTDHRKRSIPVVQQHKADTAHVVSSRAMMGNLLLGQTDTIEVCFDTPVEVLEYVFSVGQLGLGSAHEPTMTDGGRVFRLPFSMGLAGMELNCQFTVSSLGDGTVTKLDFMIPFYANRFPLDAEGETIRHSVLAEDRKSIWVSVASVVTGRHRVAQISLEDCSLMQSVEVPFAPRHVCINPYNHLLYVLPANGSIPNAGYSNTFCVIDPQQGKIVKTLTIDPSPVTNPQWPAVYPVELEFTNDGLGILLLISRGTDEYEWRYVDSADDDNIMLSGYKWHDYEHVYQNFDQSRIYATEYPTSYPHSYFISRQNMVPTTINIHGKFESDKYYAGGNLADFRMSPFANKAFICTAPGSQCVVSLDPLGYSEVCEVEARFAKCAWDECYGADRDLIYQVCPTPVSYSSFWGKCLLSLFDMTAGHHVFATYHAFLVEMYNEPMNCHFLRDTDQLVVVSYLGVYLLDAADIKRRSL